MSINRIGVKVPPTSSEQEALGVAYELLSSGAQNVGALMTTPEDDWLPIWLVLTKSQGTIFTGDVDKHVMTRAVAKWAQRVGGICVGQAASSWMILSEDVGSERAREIQRIVESHGGSTAGIAERREVVMIVLYTSGTWQMHQADISRSEDAPPTLSPFRLVLDSDKIGERGGLQGAMVDPLKEAVWRRG